MVQFPKVEVNADRNLPKIVFIAGFPDDQTSSWGRVLPDRLAQDYHCIFLCLPGYEDGGKLPPWGYSFKELIEGMHETILSLLSPNEKFVLISHDWGSALAYWYLEKYSSYVTKFITLDIGCTEIGTMPLKSTIIVFVYQSWFAFSFLLSQIFGKLFGSIIMALIFLPGFRNFLPTRNEKPPRKTKKIHAGLCYPYYYMLRQILSGNPPKFAFPTIPTLYLVSLDLHVYLLYMR
jgi:pimeloyl-ACP methyl ester carboxylesterase